jgi:hypothetical protein
MPDLSQPITFRQLLVMNPRIEIPLIQRDYAQGRETEKEVRDDFLKALYGALSLPSDQPSLPLNLDFIYGSIEGGQSGSFLPLDGQQRLTTLFLLHWYLAWHDDQYSQFEEMLWDGKHSRFTYGVRPSSAEFFDQLVRYAPDVSPATLSSISVLIADQSWFFLHWRLDPTIQAVLSMLDAIHRFFNGSSGLFNRLVNNERPAITFALLPLEHFGLSDDLYIKMNARGKPLTSFETFKARFEKLLIDLFPSERRELAGVKVSVADFFERKIDTQWTDLFWAYKNPQTNTFDEQVMNLFIAVARVSLDPANINFIQDSTLLRGRELVGTFSLFHDHGWLTRVFADNTINLLETWGRDKGNVAPLLPTTRYFDETAFFRKAIQEPTALDYAQLLQFAGFVSYLRQNEGKVEPESLNEWMRIVYNLSSNSDIERPEEFGRSLAGLDKLLPFSSKILDHLASAEIGQIGFSPQQVREEALKAKLIIANGAWRERIDQAEEHRYFSGQIEFLLDFCGVLPKTDTIPANWTDAEHTQLQASFDDYLLKAQLTFDSSGLVPTKADAGLHLWRRALLVFGDYLPSSGSNYSFLTNAPRNWDSWKRFLRSSVSGKRRLLKALWDQIDASLDIEPQLQQIIAASLCEEAWRLATIRHPEVITYCRQQEIRRGWSVKEIYLLEKRQMNGYHAELFTYVLYLDLMPGSIIGQKLTPLRIQGYDSVCLSQVEPQVVLVFERANRRLRILIESTDGQFRIHTPCNELKELPEVKSALCIGSSFVERNETLTRLVSREDIHKVLEQIANRLAELPNLIQLNSSTE